MTTRRDFFVTGAIAASLVACSSTSGESQTASPQTGDANFNKIASKAAAHKHCFGIGSVDRGEGLYAMNNLFGTYQHSFNVPLDQVNLVGVLYRPDAVTIAFSSEVWNKILIPAMPRVDAALRSNLESVHVTSGNPFLYKPANSNGEDASVESLVARGASFLVCANATQRLAITIGGALNQSPQSVYQSFESGLVDGASMVPTGVWALHALQENHFTYVQASL